MKQILMLLFIVCLPLAFALPECQRVMQPNIIPCNIISTWKPSGLCSDYSLSIYNTTGTNILNLTWGSYNLLCNVTFNITKVGTYNYNSTVENGIITIQGDDNSMILSITIFLLLFNLVVFILPMFVKFSENEVTNYVVRKLVWIAALLFLWFNTTLMRTLALNWNLGIDNFLITYWYIFTFAIFTCIFIIGYVMIMGSLKLAHTIYNKKRMGDDEN